MGKEITSSLTGLYIEEVFFEKAKIYLNREPERECYMAALDIEHFRLYNKIHGREAGNELLVMVSRCLKQFKENYVSEIGYFGGDNFAILTSADIEKVLELCEKIQNEVKRRCDSVGYFPAVGIYRIIDKNEPMTEMYDRATVALSHIKGSYVSHICEYTSDMDERLEEELRVLSEVQKGIGRDEFTFLYSHSAIL